PAPARADSPATAPAPLPAASSVHPPSEAGARPSADASLSPPGPSGARRIEEVLAPSLGQVNAPAEDGELELVSRGELTESFFLQHIREVAADHQAGLFAGTNDPEDEGIPMDAIASGRSVGL